MSKKITNLHFLKWNKADFKKLILKLLFANILQWILFYIVNIICYYKFNNDIGDFNLNWIIFLFLQKYWKVLKINFMCLSICSKMNYNFFSFIQWGMPTREHLKKHRCSKIRVQFIATPNASKILSTSRRYVWVSTNVRFLNPKKLQKR